MDRHVIVKKASIKDIHGIKEVLDSSQLFPSEYLDDMMAEFLTNAETDDIWFVAEENNDTVGFGYCVPEKLTNGTYNLLAIAVKSDLQGKGIGKQMMYFIETLLEESKPAHLHLL
jgi:ribosomal protein S18 acetylase RimI-like enzyme